ncbi:MAG TPA: portal protein [Rhizomicrobium sp.]|jgi:hypothetical protein
MGDLANDVIQQWERGSTDKVTTLTAWQQIANYTLPNRSDYLVEKTPGQKRMTYIYDAMPVWALEQNACGMHSLMTSTSLQWFFMHCDDDRINANDDVRSWLNDAASAMYGLFNSPRHNFASQSYEVYLDLASIGTACMGVLDSARNDVLFTTRHMKECVWFENEEDRIDANIRQWKWTAKQAWAQWREKAGAAVKKALDDNKPETVFQFLHGVRPRKQRDPQRADAGNMEWESVYVSLADKSEISVSGFQEFPYLCPRSSKASGEIYGRGEASIGLPDIQMLNEFKKLIVKAAQKVIDPPLQVPDSGFLMAIRTVPGSFNYYRANTTGRIEPIKTGGDIQLGIEMLNALQNQIAKTFYVDMLRMPVDPQDPVSEGKGVTATYWLQRRDKEMMMLAPTLARRQAEFLGPLIDRVFAMLWRKSKRMKFGPGSPFRMPPPQLQGQKLNIEYVSPIALAQKSTQMDGVTRLMQIQSQLKQIDNNSATIIDGEAILRLASRDWNAPVEVLKSADQLQQEAQAKAQSEAAMANHMALANVAGAAKDGSAALKNVAQAGGMPQQQMQEAT